MSTVSVLDKECLLEVARERPQLPKFPVIDAHSHWGRLLGEMENTGHPFDLYDTKDAVERIKSYGVKRIVNADGVYGDEYLRMMDKLKDAGDFIVNYGWVDVSRFEEPDFERYVYRTIRDHAANGIKGLKFWKIIGLKIRDHNGRFLRPDDKRLQCIWQTAAEFHLPVLFHMSDLHAFFKPIDERNEYIDTFREHPEWSFSGPEFYSWQELKDMEVNVLAQNPQTTFMLAHVASNAENLAQVGQWMDTFPNMYVDIADRLNELGRQPYTARNFFLRHADRIIFGTDLLPNDVERYPLYWEYLETYDEYFPYRTKRGVSLGDWNIYGIHLPDDVLEQVYYKNAERVLGLSV